MMRVLRQRVKAVHCRRHGRNRQRGMGSPALGINKGSDPQLPGKRLIRQHHQEVAAQVRYGLNRLTFVPKRYNLSDFRPMIPRLVDRLRSRQRPTTRHGRIQGAMGVRPSHGIQEQRQGVLGRYQGQDLTHNIG